MEFTKEQQAFIDTLIGEKYTEAYAKASQKFQSEFAEKNAALTQELTAIKTQLHDAEKKLADKVGGAGNDVDVTELKAEVKKLKERELVIREREKRAALISVAAELNAVSPEQVADLVSSKAKINEDGSISIYGVDGQLILDAQGQPKGHKAFVEDFLRTNPHHVRVTTQPGGGSTNPQGGKNAMYSRKDFEKLPAHEQQKIATTPGMVFTD